MRRYVVSIYIRIMVIFAYSPQTYTYNVCGMFVNIVIMSSLRKDACEDFLSFDNGEYFCEDIC